MIASAPERIASRYTVSPDQALDALLSLRCMETIVAARSLGLDHATYLSILHSDEAVVDRLNRALRTNTTLQSYELATETMRAISTALADPIDKPDLTTLTRVLKEVAVMLHAGINRETPRSTDVNNNVNLNLNLFDQAVQSMPTNLRDTIVALTDAGRAESIRALDGGVLDAESRVLSD